MEIPHLGKVTKDSRYNLYYSESTPVPVLGGRLCRFVLERYDEDSNKEEFHIAIANFLSADESVLKAAAPHVFQYYKDSIAYWGPHDGQPVKIDSPTGVWEHVQFGKEPRVTRRSYGKKGIYISLECECDWEEEHGLQIVFKNGLEINKVGPYDGHLTNSDAYADDRLEDVVYAHP